MSHLFISYCSAEHANEIQLTQEWCWVRRRLKSERMYNYCYTQCIAISDIVVVTLYYNTYTGVQVRTNTRTTALFTLHSVFYIYCTPHVQHVHAYRSTCTYSTVHVHGMY